LNKKELIGAICNMGELKKVDAEKALDATLNAITETLKKGETVTLVGFGSFAVTKRQARQGRNPQNGVVLNIPAKNAVKFKAEKNLI
jgi:DNA-binding protein HU-beta